MHNRYLDVFVIIAETGSITKAAEKLFISTTALNKQLHLFEEHLHVKLFDRSVRGVVLTEAGKFIYQEAKEIINHSNFVRKKVIEISSNNEYTIRLGTSLINNSNKLYTYIDAFNKLHPNISFETVPPHANNKSEYLSVIKRLGHDVDIFLRPTATSYGENFCTITLMHLPAEIIMSRKHPLASRQKLSITDLHGETLILLDVGVAYDTDNVRALLSTEHPEVNILNVKYYSNKTFNKLITDNCLLLHSSQWMASYPMFTAVPVDWDFKIPYGIVYPKDPPHAVSLFVEFIKEQVYHPYSDSDTL